VNSPGGSPAASQEIYEEVKKMEKPVVVSGSGRPSVYDILMQYYLEGFIKNLLSMKY
jgi:hypothetical protein